MTVYEALAGISVGAALVFAGRLVWALRGFRIRTEARWSEMDKADDAFVAACFQRYHGTSTYGGRRPAYYDVVELLRRACSDRDALISAVVGKNGEARAFLQVGANAMGPAVERAKQLRQERFLLIEAILGTGKAVAIERGVQGVLDVAKEHQRQRQQMLGGPDPEGRWGAWQEDVRADVERAAQNLGPNSGKSAEQVIAEAETITQHPEPGDKGGAA